ncbi:MAG: PA-phosphatase, partial [Mycobacterium sp.]|nr:PA-phosphatase [Mycobacterium sp.]
YLQQWSWVDGMDSWLLGLFTPIGAAHPAWVTAWDVFCTVLGPTAFRIGAVGVIIWLFIRRYVRAALFLVVSIELSGLVTQTFKYVADRARPDTAMVHAFGTSFPSGHALGVMVSVLALLTVLLPLIPVRWHRPLIVVGVAIVVLIGLGRVVLNVHHPSDVLAGWGLGYLWYLASMLMLRPLPLTISAAGKPEVPDTASGT